MSTPLDDLASSAFVASWLGRARDGDLFDKDPSRRASSWAYWALRHMNSYTGVSERPYVALTLPGTFYDPRGDGPAIRPHLELPTAMFSHPDALFPERLAQAGNGLLFEWWLMPEVVALKRAVLGLPRGDISGLDQALNEHRPGLLSAFGQLQQTLLRAWPDIQADLIAEPELVSDALHSGFTTAELDEFFPAGKKLSLSIHPEEKLCTSAGKWLSRRVGVWVVKGHDGAKHPFSLGVVTPRLTKSSLFTDPLFAPSKESSAALLVRSLIARRLLLGYSGDLDVVVEDTPAERKAQPFLRAVPASVGEKIPEASLASAVLFVQAYPQPAQAWELLRKWADTSEDGESPRAVLTVTKESFQAAHAAISQAVKHSETPSREDVNVLLPIAWDSGSKVVRVTMSRPAENKKVKG